MVNKVNPDLKDYAINKNIFNLIENKIFSENSDIITLSLLIQIINFTKIFI